MAQKHPDRTDVTQYHCDDGDRRSCWGGIGAGGDGRIPLAQEETTPPQYLPTVPQHATTCHIWTVSGLSLASGLLFAQMPTARPQRGQRSGDAMEMHRASVLAVAATQ